MPLSLASKITLFTTLLIGLGGCSIKTSDFPDEDYGPDTPVDVSHIPDAVPRNAPRSKYGNPSSYTVLGKTYHVLPDAKGYREQGLASWYGNKFHGKRTSSGEPYDMYAMTAAHKTLPLPTWVRVTNLDNGKAVVVKVNDRGPFHSGRIIDLSYAAASKLGVLAKGTARVEVAAVLPGKTSAPAQISEKKTAANPVFPLWVQVGAFSSQANAYQEQQRLQNLSGVAGRIQVADNSGKPVFRVWLGPVSNAQELQQITEKLPDWGVTAHRLVEAGNRE